jgi:hypothetical protein
MGDVTFRIRPSKVDKGGAGRYQIQYEGKDLPMNALSDVGPFVWSRGDERHTLLASSETEFLWHRLTLGPVPVAAVRFLSCTVRQ